jgi:hypothetical protein
MCLSRFGDVCSHSASLDLPSLRPSPGCLLLPSAVFSSSFSDFPPAHGTADRIKKSVSDRIKKLVILEIGHASVYDKCGMAEGLSAVSLLNFCVCFDGLIGVGRFAS